MTPLGAISYNETNMGGGLQKVKSLPKIHNDTNDPYMIAQQQITDQRMSIGGVSDAIRDTTIGSGGGLPQHHYIKQLRQHHDDQQQLRMTNNHSQSQIKSNETQQMMQAFFEQSKGDMSPSPDMRISQPPNVLTSQKKTQHRSSLLYSSGGKEGQ